MTVYFRFLLFFMLVFVFSVKAAPSPCEAGAFTNREIPGGTLNQLKSVLYSRLLVSHREKMEELIRKLEPEEIRALSNRDIVFLHKRGFLSRFSLEQLEAFTSVQFNQNIVLSTYYQEAIREKKEKERFLFPADVRDEHIPSGD